MHINDVILKSVLLFKIRLNSIQLNGCLKSDYRQSRVTIELALLHIYFRSLENQFLTPKIYFHVHKQPVKKFNLELLLNWDWADQPEGLCESSPWTILRVECFIVRNQRSSSVSSCTTLSPDRARISLTSI